MYNISIFMGYVTCPNGAGDKMIKFGFKKSEDNLEINFSCDFEKIISLIIGTTTLVETILYSL
ncbi:hypothetical protein MKX31_07525 [Bacillus sp. FSL M8-0063]|uniref:hypothetical protein n=1 Tax=Bacillus sp. FSL M8-0063 TaxID=2921566 RepID=UPI0030FC47C6